MNLIHAGEYAFKTTIGMEQKTTYKDTARNYRKDPAVSIPTTGRDQREKVYISKQHYVADHCSPGARVVASGQHCNVAKASHLPAGCRAQAQLHHHDARILKWARRK
jgi:hypothetical protein